MDNLLSEEISAAIHKVVPQMGYDLIDQLINTEENELYIFHFGFGMWLRNNILTEGSDIRRLFVENGVVHKDDMSSILIREFHKRLMGK